MTDEHQLADAFWQMRNAALRINEIFNRNPALAENLPVQRLFALDADEIADECRVLAEYYEKPASA
jgi:O-phosphoseryl-tRNA(Cys) synthetase